MGRKSKLGILSRHHIIPSTRGGSDGPLNIIYPPHYLHVAYHILFINSKPLEVLEQLNDYWSGKNDRFLHSSKSGNFKKKKAYEDIFDNMSKEEIVDYLDTHWFNALTSKYKK